MKAEILEYKNENLKEKTSFNDLEKGCVGYFHLRIHEFKRKKSGLVIFAPDQENFNNKNYPGTVENHRFLSYLDETFKEELEESIFCGGKVEDYEINNKIMTLSPTFKDSGIIYPSDEDTSKRILNLSVWKKFFNIKETKIGKALY